MIIFMLVAILSKTAILNSEAKKTQPVSTKICKLLHSRGKDFEIVAEILLTKT